MQQSLSESGDAGRMEVREAEEPQRQIDGGRVGERYPIARELIFRLAPAPAVSAQVPLKKQPRQKPRCSRRPHQAKDKETAARAERSSVNNQPVKNCAEREGENQVDQNRKLRAICFFIHRLNTSCADSSQPRLDDRQAQFFWRALYPNGPSKPKKMNERESCASILI